MPISPSSLADEPAPPQTDLKITIALDLSFRSFLISSLEIASF